MISLMCKSATPQPPIGGVVRDKTSLYSCRELQHFFLKTLDSSERMSEKSAYAAYIIGGQKIALRTWENPWQGKRYLELIHRIVRVYNVLSMDCRWTMDFIIYTRGFFNWGAGAQSQGIPQSFLFLSVFIATSSFYTTQLNLQVCAHHIIVQLNFHNYVQ